MNLRDALPGRIQQTNVGKTNAQNLSQDIRHRLGGMDYIIRGTACPSIEFSIKSVAASCESTRTIHISICFPQTPTSDQLATLGDDTIVSIVYFTFQKVAVDRTCSSLLGVGAAYPL